MIVASVNDLRRDRFFTLLHIYREKREWEKQRGFFDNTPIARMERKHQMSVFFLGYTCGWQDRESEG